MKWKIVLCFLLAAVFSFNALQALPLSQGFDKAAFYRTMKDGNVDDIDNELSRVDASSFSEKDAYKGTLQMKKAGMIKKAKDKMDLFKSGRIKLETALHGDPNNTEYRFLRLMIQEHAPKVTKYKSQLDEDSEYIKKNYNKLSPDVQEIVKDYSKSSAILHPEDF
ncbi:hypothetical protein QTN47_11365 [Danxiaibacter flavus]|uniref:DUF4142 domain-containing protein n=1 Tax=Danxiaibacter flavus TaxID=3049108 RepID=A0ABV3ZHW1_9BACT|nr:hypothetical protein QNM32_11370 [Chitinophagaceae bacterium DXS]